MKERRAYIRRLLYFLFFLHEIIVTEITQPSDSEGVDQMHTTKRMIKRHTLRNNSTIKLLLPGTFRLSFEMLRSFKSQTAHNSQRNSPCNLKCRCIPLFTVYCSPTTGPLALQQPSPNPVYLVLPCTTTPPTPGQNSGHFTKRPAVHQQETA